jgi:hypothetical protein
VSASLPNSRTQFFDRPTHREWLVTKTPLRLLLLLPLATTESWFKTSDDGVKWKSP